MDEIQTIDPDVLWESACGDRKTAAELLDLFFVQAEEDMSRLIKAGAADDVSAAAESAHKLVGSSLACGLAGLASDLHHLEQQCRQSGMPRDVDERLKCLTLRLAEARVFFEASWGGD